MLTNKQNIREAMSSQASLNNLAKGMNKHYCQMDRTAGKSGSKNDNEPEYSLVIFNRKCLKCGKEGYKATDCRKMSGNG